MQQISINNQLKKLLPRLRLGCMECSVHTQPSSREIISLSDGIFADLCNELTIDQISQKLTIRETKEAYRVLGKDPSRYRPSAEALTRRIVGGKDLFWINNIVDILNLISLESGFSIGGYDADKIIGTIEFGIGKKKEPYQAIGRGALNIENLPLFRDDLGPFGSPTSDSLRTMVTEETTRFLMVIIDFGGNEKLESTIAKSEALYQKFANVREISTQIVSAQQ
jgi:DNA/RNA-binding domain of Phe-tRNA-synthetase-like protein